MEEGHSTRSKRSPPLTSLEQELLIELVQTHISVVEDRRTDFGTNGKKQKAWETIETKFNSNEGVTKRDKEQLRKFWYNTKTQAKAQVAKHKKKIRKTGGGTAPPCLTADVIRVVGMVPSQMEPMENPFDCDNDQSSVVPNILELDVDENFVSDGTQNENQPSSTIQIILPVTSQSTVPIGNNPCASTSTSSVAPAPSVANESAQISSKRARAYKDARASLVDMEYEEHKIRLKILAEELEAAKLKRKHEEMRVKVLKENNPNVNFD